MCITEHSGYSQANRLDVALMNETWPWCRHTQRHTQAFRGVINTGLVTLTKTCSYTTCFSKFYELYICLEVIVLQSLTKSHMT